MEQKTALTGRSSIACGILFCYNEEQILSETLSYYLSQGIDLVIFDNCSADSSLDIVKAFRANSAQYDGKIRDIISISTEGYDWEEILRSACEYMHKKLNHYEWILLIDADAFYSSPVKGLSLKGFMAAVKERGYNIIDGKVYEFYPSEKDDFTVALPTARIKYYRIRDQWNEQKMFLYHPTIDFYTKFGHVCIRNNPHIWNRVRFIYKHYPWISYKHGLKKVFGERKARNVIRNRYPRRHPDNHIWSLLPIKKDFVKESKDLLYYEEKKVLLSKFSFLCISKSGEFSNYYFVKLIRSFLNRFRKYILYIRRHILRPRLIKGSDAAAFTEPYAKVFPKTYHFLMINYCNANCIFCNQIFNNGPNKEISLGNFKTMAANIPADSAKFFYFSGGGEPLLCRELFPIVKYTNETFPWVKINIRTNGLLIGEFADDLAESNISRLEISVHGLTETNDAILQRKGSQAIFDGIDLLNRKLRDLNKKIDKVFYTVISQLNIHEVPELIKKAAELEINEIKIPLCQYFSDRPDIEIEKGASLFFHQQLYDGIIEKSKKLADSLGICFKFYPLSVEYFKAVKHRCSIPWTTAIVDWDGDIYPCPGFEVQIQEKVKSGEYYFGNLLKEHLYQSWNNESWIKMRRTCSHKYNEGFIPEAKNCPCLLGIPSILREKIC